MQRVSLTVRGRWPRCHIVIPDLIFQKVWYRRRISAWCIRALQRDPFTAVAESCNGLATNPLSFHVPTTMITTSAVVSTLPPNQATRRSRRFSVTAWSDRKTIPCSGKTFRVKKS